VHTETVSAGEYPHAAEGKNQPDRAGVSFDQA